LPIADITDWLDEQLTLRPVIVAKRLAGNDTGASGAHQAGPYIPKAVFSELFPNAPFRSGGVQDWPVTVFIDSHVGNPSSVREARLVWYPSKQEGRITNLGGRQSPLMDPDATGAVAVFSFVPKTDGLACHVWVSHDEDGTDIDEVEDAFGPVEPKRAVFWRPAEGLLPGIVKPIGMARCNLGPSEVPPAWLSRFPAGREIVEFAIERHPCARRSPDVRLLRRRDCEFAIFKSIEDNVLPARIASGFARVEDFLKIANEVLQRRKSRGGKSLEYQVHAILREEGLRENVDFQHNAVVENGKRPDFIFPSGKAYDDPTFPVSRLRMLAAKSTFKDRWRQVTQEATRITIKHLLTVQEGVSEAQFRDMWLAGVRLVVPTELHRKYPKPVRDDLLSLEGFIADVRTLAV